jgi:hypothetical protein
MKDLDCLWKFCKWVNHDEQPMDGLKKGFYSKKDSSKEPWFWSKFLDYIQKVQNPEIS